MVIALEPCSPLSHFWVPSHNKNAAHQNRVQNDTTHPKVIFTSTKIISLLKLCYYLHAGHIISVLYKYCEVRTAATRKQSLHKFTANSELYLGKLNADKGLLNPTDEALLSLLHYLHEPRGANDKSFYIYFRLCQLRGALFLIIFIIKEVFLERAAKIRKEEVSCNNKWREDERRPSPPLSGRKQDLILQGIAKPIAGNSGMWLGITYIRLASNWNSYIEASEKLWLVMNWRQRRRTGTTFWRPHSMSLIGS
jgi:hypothetical protein